MTDVTIAATGQACELLIEMARLAHEGDRICFYGPDNPDPAEAQLNIDTLRRLLQRIGWLADLASDKLGQEMLIGDAAAWMLPPMYHEVGASHS